MNSPSTGPFENQSPHPKVSGGRDAGVRDANLRDANVRDHGIHDHGVHDHGFDFKELGDLLELLCEERLTSQDLQRLEQILHGSAMARAHYLAYIDLHGALYWDMAVAVPEEEDAVAALVDSTILRLAHPGPLQTRDAAETFDRPFAPTFDSTLVNAALVDASSMGSEAATGQASGRTGRARKSQRHRWVRQAGMGVAACLILGLGVWIGNQTARPRTGMSATPAESSQSTGSHSTDPNSTAPESAANPDRTAVAGVGAQRFSPDDVQLGPTGISTTSESVASQSIADRSGDREGPSDREATNAARASNAGSNEKVAGPTGTAAVATSGQSSTDHTLTNPALAGTASASSTKIIAFVNHELKATWDRSEISPSAKADDAEWLRRLHLDLLGHIPAVSDVEKFIANRSPTKRSIEIDRLLDSPAFARNFAAIWTNLLVGRLPREEVNRQALATFLRQSFGRNRPWHEIVFDLVAAEGRTDQNGAANFLVAHLNGGAIPATGITSRLFLGAHLQCAQCHNHPFSDSKQEQFWAFNSFFQQAVVVRVPKYDAKTGRMVVAGIELATKDIDGPVYYETRSGLMKVAYPAFGTTKVDTSQVTSRRRELARLMTEREDSGLAPAFINRMWAHFHGRGFTAVVDDMGPHAPPSHPQLLDRLSEEFVHSGYDIKQLIRWICNSDSYQLTSKFGENNDKDDPETGEPPVFSHMYVKPMSPEQMYDSLVVATQGQLAGGPTLDQSDRTRDEWLKQFIVSFETEENDEVSTLNGSITQSLLMMNGDLIQKATEVQAGTWLHKLLAAKGNDTERIQALFTAALSRPATTRELAGVRKILKSNANHNKPGAIESAYQDIYWALLNSNEFILNH